MGSPSASYRLAPLFVVVVVCLVEMVAFPLPIGCKIRCLDLSLTPSSLVDDFRELLEEPLKEPAMVVSARVK